MKFTEKYKDVGIGYITEENMLSEETEGNCSICNEKTIWYEIDYNAPICSEECLDLWSIQTLNEEYNNTLSKE